MIHVKDCWLEGYRCKVFLDMRTSNSRFEWPASSTEPFAKIIVGGDVRYGDTVMENLLHEIMEGVLVEWKLSFRHDHGHAGHGSDGRLFIMSHEQFTTVCRSTAVTLNYIYDELKAAWLKANKERKQGGRET